MRTIFTTICIMLHLNLLAQTQIPVPQPDSVLTFSADSVKPKVKLIPKIKIFVRKEIIEDPSQELKLLTRSAIIITSVSAAGAATYAFADEPLRNFMLSNRTDFTRKASEYIEPLGRTSRMLYTAGSFYAAGLLVKDKKLQRAGILAASSMLINDVVTSQLKDEFQRRRPSVSSHNHYFEGGEGGRHHASFPSAHTSTAFTFATSFATVYKDSKWIPPVAYGAATLVGLSRIHDNHHWATDVLAGAAVGFLTAKTTNFILKQTEKKLEKRKINIYLSPRVSAGSLGLGIGGTL